MQTLKIDATKFTPRIILDPQKDTFQISGFSLPENVSEFYTPILTWLDAYALELNGNEEIRFVFKLIYYNSGSFKVIINILQKIVAYEKIGVKLIIEWNYDEDDYQLKDIGIELSELVDHKFVFVTNE